MTLHTKAATDDILDIFNQPLRNVDTMAGPADSAGESDYEDDDYTSAGESTGTGRISGTSEFGDTEADLVTAPQVENTSTAAPSVSPWSDFTASKHVPKLAPEEDEDRNSTDEIDNDGFVVLEDSASIKADKDEDIEIVTPVLPEPEPEYEAIRTRYVPIPPEDYEPSTRPYRDPSQASQNRLPFMTPIVEKTESSMGALTLREEKDYFNSKTPSRGTHGHATPQIDEELLSSPFDEIVNDSLPPRVPRLKIATFKSTSDADVAKDTKGPIIKDAQCNPVDDSIRKTILENIRPPLSSYPGYYDCRPLSYNKAPEIRKYIKALTRKPGSEKTITTLSLPPTLRFPQTSSKTYAIKRELGKGAFAPVYLAQEEDQDEEQMVAIKCEDPPTAWEFYIMSLLQTRLSPTHRASASLLKPLSLHLFADEAYLVESYLDQGTLLDLVNLAKSDPTPGNTTGTLDESIAMFFTIELLRTIEAMHNVDILHGDLKADNCLVRLSPTGEEWDPAYQPDGSGGWACKGLCLIDFGRGIDMRAFNPDVQFVADWKTGKQDCVEMRELRPWTYQVDYYGIAGVVHSLLFGRYIEDMIVDDKVVGTTDGGIGAKKKYKLREGLKRYWQTDLWGSLFEILLNPGTALEAEEGGKMPVVRGLRVVRERMEEWLSGEGGRRNGGLKGGLRRFEEMIKERRKK